MSEAQKKKLRTKEETTEAAEIARFYGFKGTLCPEISKQDIDSVKNFNEAYFPEEKAALLRKYFDDKKVVPYQTMSFYCERPFPGTSVHKKKAGKIEGALVYIGSNKSMAECLIIETAFSILNAAGYKNLEVRLNSIGDKDSINAFQKNLSAFIRKNINSFPSDLRQEIKRDQIAALKCKEEWKTFEKECPKTMDFLSEQSRLHFKEILEFMEVMDIPYSIDHSLVGDLEMGSETVFSIRSDEEELAYGFRFNRLAKKIGYKKDVPCVILNIGAKSKKEIKKIKHKRQKPKFYLVQFGAEARLQSFLILRELYRAKVSVLHSIDKDRLGDQMAIAERSGASYVLLVGQKEALDGSVVIRNVATRSQESVPVSSLSGRAKELD